MLDIYGNNLSSIIYSAATVVAWNRALPFMQQYFVFLPPFLYLHNCKNANCNHATTVAALLYSESRLQMKVDESHSLLLCLSEHDVNDIFLADVIC
jgi:hypothetical protein